MKLAIFDIDGTLTDSTQVDDQCMAATFTHFLGTKAACDWQAVTHVTDPVIVKETAEHITGKPCSQSMYEEMKKYFFNALAERSRGQSLAVFTRAELPHIYQ